MNIVLFSYFSLYINVYVICFAMGTDTHTETPERHRRW